MGCGVRWSGGRLAPRTMKRQIGSKRLYEAFIKGRLGTEEDYPVWTPLWALRARIWQGKSLRKLAGKQLGDLVMEAVGRGFEGGAGRRMGLVALIGRRASLNSHRGGSPNAVRVGGPAKPQGECQGR